MTPPQVKAKEFEALLLKSAARSKHMTMSRYPVASVIVKGSNRPLQQLSLPDFEGVIDGGRQFIIEAKVCSQSSFPLDKSKIKPRQVSHMLERASFGVRCWVVIHFNERKLVRTHEGAGTYAIPVNGWMPFWERFVEAHRVAAKLKAPVATQGSISRADAVRIGTKVRWIKPGQLHNPIPDLEHLLGLDPELV